MDSTLVALVCAAGAYAVVEIFRPADDDNSSYLDPMTWAAIAFVGVVAFRKMYDKE